MNIFNVSSPIKSAKVKGPIGTFLEENNRKNCKNPIKITI